MNPRFADLLPIVTRAPWWVWLILLILVVGGVSRLRARTIPLARLVVLPSVFLVWGLTSLGLRLGGNPALALPWVGAALLGALLGWSTAPAGIRADRATRRILVPGRAAPLVASLTVFLLKYGINVATAIRPDARDAIAIFDMAVSGMSAGYFWSGLVRTFMRYRSAPGFDIPGTSVPANA